MAVEPVRIGVAEGQIGALADIGDAVALDCDRGVGDDAPMRVDRHRRHVGDQKHDRALRYVVLDNVNPLYARRL